MWFKKLIVLAAVVGESCSSSTGAPCAGRRAICLSQDAGADRRHITFIYSFPYPTIPSCLDTPHLVGQTIGERTELWGTPGSITPFQLSYPGLDYLINVLRASTEDLAQDLLSSLEFLGLYIYRPDMLAHKEDLLFRPHKLLDDPCHDHRGCEDKKLGRKSITESHFYMDLRVNGMRRGN